MKKNWITPGMEVAHIDNPDKKMRAEEMVRRTRKLPDGNIAEFLVGVRCTWFDKLPSGEKKAMFMIYHTNTLIPWEVAKEGPTGIAKFRNSL